MSQKFDKCEILDDDEMGNKVFNFRRFEVEELQRKFSPFEKTKHQKKEFPFLFQKKKTKIFEDKKISIDELMGKIDNLKVDENKNLIIDDTGDIGDELKERTSYTPEWPRTLEELEAVHQEIVEHYANLKKKEEEIKEDNGE
jgi:hypothetical protein